MIEALCLGGAAALLAALLFMRSPDDVVGRAIVLCAPIVLVMIAALRFGLAGAASALLIGACVAIGGAVHGVPPFRSPSTTTGIVAQQLVLLALATPLLFLAVAIDERRRVTSQLTQNDARYALATQAGGVFVYAHDPDVGRGEHRWPVRQAPRSRRVGHGVARLVVAAGASR